MSLFTESGCLPGSDKSFEYSSILFDTISPFQHIQVFDSLHSGHILVLDGIIQVIERSEASYHEMMTHPALSLPHNFSRVLILGGGDGGCAREVLRHSQVSQVIVCDIDEVVTSVSRTFFPSIFQSLDDTRLEWVHMDGAEYIHETGILFDLIILDATDDENIGSRLHARSIFAMASKRLTDNGALVCYGDSPFFARDMYEMKYAILREYFPRVTPYLAYVPMYQSGCWSFFVASQRLYDLCVPQKKEGDFHTLSYYSSQIQRASTVLPAFLARDM